MRCRLLALALAALLAPPAARAAERPTGFSALAAREGFLVAYPEGLGRNWNDGREFSGKAHPKRSGD